jgi:hypothetical protein
MYHILLHSIYCCKPTVYTVNFIYCIFLLLADYWLDGPGSNPGGDEIFRLSRPVLGSTQPPVKWVSGLSRG